MRLVSARFRSLALGIAGALLLAGSASAAEVRVMISGGLTAAYKALVPEFERTTGNKVVTERHDCWDWDGSGFTLKLPVCGMFELNEAGKIYVHVGADVVGRNRSRKHHCQRLLEGD